MSWWRRRDPNECRVTEDWGGLTIGRRYCSTHGQRWDDGGPCPEAAS